MADDLILLKLASRFKALGSTQGLRIIHLLVVENESGLTLAELAWRLNAKPGAIRRQLNLLLAEDMIECVFPGPQPTYRARSGVLKDLLDYITPARSGHRHYPEYPLPSCCWPPA